MRKYSLDEEGYKGVTRAPERHGQAEGPAGQQHTAWNSASGTPELSRECASLASRKLGLCTLVVSNEVSVQKPDV